MSELDLLVLSVRSLPLVSRVPSSRVSSTGLLVQPRPNPSRNASRDKQWAWNLNEQSLVPNAISKSAEHRSRSDQGKPSSEGHEATGGLDGLGHLPNIFSAASSRLASRGSEGSRSFTQPSGPGFDAGTPDSKSMPAQRHHDVQRISESASDGHDSVPTGMDTGAQDARTADDSRPSTSHHHPGPTDTLPPLSHIPAGSHEHRGASPTAATSTSDAGPAAAVVRPDSPRPDGGLADPSKGRNKRRKRRARAARVSSSADGAFLETGKAAAPRGAPAARRRLDLGAADPSHAATSSSGKPAAAAADGASKTARLLSARVSQSLSMPAAAGTKLGADRAPFSVRKSIDSAPGSQALKPSAARPLPPAQAKEDKALAQILAAVGAVTAGRESVLAAHARASLGEPEPSSDAAVPEGKAASAVARGMQLEVVYGSKAKIPGLVAVAVKRTVKAEGPTAQRTVPPSPHRPGPNPPSESSCRSGSAPQGAASDADPAVMASPHKLVVNVAEEQRKARLRLAERKQADEQRRAEERAGEQQRKEQRRQAREQDCKDRERRRLNIYAWNAILAKIEGLQAQAFLEVGNKEGAVGMQHAV